jgi:hypothetical protein
MKKIEQLAIAATALLVLSAYLGACGNDGGLHPNGAGGNGGGGPGGHAGDGVQGVGGTPFGVGGAPFGVGGYPISGTGGGLIFGIGGSGTGGSGIGGSGVGGSGTGGAPAGCAQITTQTACDANPSCYSVFFDPNTCGCATAGCCARFNHCAEGPAGAQCYGGVSCALNPPFCEGPYVVSYRGECYEGCVNSMDCAPVCTIGADQTCNDNPIISSLHGHCTAAGTCQCGTGLILNPNTGRCL